MRYPLATWIPSPNYRPGRDGATPRFIVLHKQEGSQAGSISWFKSPSSQVSAHFLVSKTGDVVQMVDTADTAWHCIGGNRVSFAIELAGYTTDGYSPAQWNATVSLCTWLAESHLIPLRSTADGEDARGGFIGHGEGAATGWGGTHLGCPGRLVLDRKQELVKACQRLVALAHPKATLSAHALHLLHRLHLKRG